MKLTLGGATFVWRGNDQDYNFKETIDCLLDLCDQVSIAAGGTDGTWEDVVDHLSNHPMAHKATLWYIQEDDWNSQHGREKLSYFSNIAIDRLATDYVLYCQCDEVVHEDSEPYIRAAIETGHEAFWCQRLNLWKSPSLMLNVPQERKPCSTEVARLAKRNYRCIDDAESLGVNREDCYVMGDIANIQIFHMGFIRDPVKHLEKIRHVQVEVFQFADYDEKAKNCDRLEPDRWFNPEVDLAPIPRPLPKYIQQWCRDRYPDLRQ
jgi:hypothetical protein